MMWAPEVELRWWDGCPSTDKALEQLRAALCDLGLDPTRVKTTQITSDAAAEAAGFVGSPTILVDGADVQPPNAAEPLGVSCRVYRRRDGGISTVPDPEDLRDALRNALAKRGLTG